MFKKLIGNQYTHTLALCLITSVTYRVPIFPWIEYRMRNRLYLLCRLSHSLAIPVFL